VISCLHTWKSLTYIVSSARMDQGVKGPCQSEQADNNSCTIHSFPNSKAQSFYLALKICLKLLEKLHCSAIKSARCLVYTILGNLTNTRYGTIHSKGVPRMATIFSPGWLLVRGDHPQYNCMSAWHNQEHLSLAAWPTMKILTDFFTTPVLAVTTMSVGWHPSSLGRHTNTFPINAHFNVRA